jgi:hypothetical protein
VFAAFWCAGLLVYDELASIDWSWLALDGAMGKAPLGEEAGKRSGHAPLCPGHYHLAKHSSTEIGS